MRKYQRLTFTLLCILFLIQPGFNVIQQYQIHQGQPVVRDAPVQVPAAAVIPVRVSPLAFLQPPNLTAKSAMVIDLSSGSILYEKEPDTKLYPASTTKIMTALVALETYPLDRVITIDKESETVGNTMKLKKDEQMTVENLLKGLLIPSGNDAAFALANAYPTGYNGFVARMNEKAQELHMTNTSYVSVSGVEVEDHVTTVRDLATLTKEAMKNDFFRTTVGTQHLIVTDVSGTISHELKTTNQLLGVLQGVEGVKTGWTTQAGECLVTQTTRNGHTILTVVLASTDRFGESARLINWAFANHEWKVYRFED